MKQLREKYLLFRIKSLKDTKAFGLIYDRYVKQVYRFIYFKVGKREDAEDLTSEVFLKSWQYLQEENRTVKSLNSLLYTIARNLVIDFYRQQAGRQEVSENILSAIGKTDESFSKLDVKIEMDSVKKGLCLLKEEYREVIILRFIDELSTTEIAEILGKSKNNVRVLLGRALKTLRAVVEADKPEQ